MIRRPLTLPAVVLALVCAARAATAQGSVAGDWELTLEGPQGATTVTLTLQQQGDKLTGEFASPLGAMPVTGTLTDGAMAVSAKIEMQGMSLELGLRGKVAGDALTGTVKIGDFGEFPFTGKRKAAVALSATSPAPEPAPPTPGHAVHDVSGRWNVTLSLGGAGEFLLSAVLKQDGDKVTGTISSAMGEVAVQGAMAATALKLGFAAEGPQGQVEIAMTGELAGDELKGKASVAGLGEADWKATRQK